MNPKFLWIIPSSTRQRLVGWEGGEARGGRGVSRRLLFPRDKPKSVSSSKAAFLSIPFPRCGHINISWQMNGRTSCVGPPRKTFKSKGPHALSLCFPCLQPVAPHLSQKLQKSGPQGYLKSGSCKSGWKSRKTARPWIPDDRMRTPCHVVSSPLEFNVSEQSPFT